MKNIINGSIVLITGGTGTFGSAFLKRILQFNPKQVRIFSRDEKKQILLRNELRQYNNIKYIIGDIRDISSVQRAMTGVDYVFHAAAMKQIPACEENPIEALKTNVLGSNNVLESAIDAGVKKIVCISTDKAVNPTSTMGLTKLYMEKLALQKAKEQDKTSICLVRFCNLIYSSGSVVPLFISQIKNNQPLTITDPSMSRHFISIRQAIDLVETAFFMGRTGDIFISNGGECTVLQLAQVVLQITNEPDPSIIISGKRPGEKNSEELFTEEESRHLLVYKDFYVIRESAREDLTFSTTKRLLNNNEIKQMILESMGGVE